MILPLLCHSVFCDPILGAVQIPFSPIWYAHLSLFSFIKSFWIPYVYWGLLETFSPNFSHLSCFTFLLRSFLVAHFAFSVFPFFVFNRWRMDRSRDMNTPRTILPILIVSVLFTFLHVSIFYLLVPPPFLSYVLFHTLFSSWTAGYRKHPHKHKYAHSPPHQHKQSHSHPPTPL